MRIKESDEQQLILDLNKAIETFLVNTSQLPDNPEFEGQVEYLKEYLDQYTSWYVKDIKFTLNIFREHN